MLSACSATPYAAGNAAEKASQVAKNQAEQIGKPVIYQVFTRLFGNTKSNNIAWGTLEQNGVGKFADFTPKALNEIKALGVTHIWFTGVLHHALVTDYTAFGIAADDPDVVKGRAGSPYAVKDYYDVNPDLALDPANRLAEFEALITRAHQAGLKVLIDIVPNHVARNYQSLSKPAGVRDFGADDNTQLAYDKHNDFYYVTGESLVVPVDPAQPVLGGEAHPLADGYFAETPAKWTGNGARTAKPDINDWYETVKVNYGVRPDGSFDFETLPKGYENADFAAHHDFWQGKALPSAWRKFHDIALYWLDKGVDGFRYDMAEMVPVEFWSYLNSAIKTHSPDALLLAEVYNPSLYRPYLQLGKMDYLYDKVGFYDNLKWLMQGKADSEGVWQAFNTVRDIDRHMLHFLENHDEQRIASPEFAGDARKGLPAMVVSHLIGTSPTMLYFGQTVGEAGGEHAGFGQPSRTSIFDYIGVPAHQAWMNHGKFDGALLTPEQHALRRYYQSLMPLAQLPAVVSGTTTRLAFDAAAPGKVIAFMRQTEQQTLLVASNFDSEHAQTVTLTLPENVTGTAQDLLEQHGTLSIRDNTLTVTLAPLASAVMQVEK
ncbi:alpha-amylase family glycosyl hydrolase [Pseudoalteromonas fenneropenaei]|uniref:Alpha-amylase family glycosyl hydrolase n=1 Tax=Pseudoalteromonas fenneropenaei TaxID=1737459 RepID=A0ABV7CNE1_9GAMM